MVSLGQRFLSGRNPWGLADQILISGTNFATMVFVGRGLGKAGFGEFSLVYNVLLFANIFQVALISQPHNVLGTNQGRGKSYSDYTASTAGQQLAMLLLQTGIGLMWVAAASIRGWNSIELLVAFIPAMAGWALQEFFRRILYTEGRLGEALANDVIAYGAQAMWIMALYWRDQHAPVGATPLLTGASALYILAMTSGAAAALGFFQVRTSLAGHMQPQAWLKNWNFGKWIVGSEMLVYFCSLPMYMNLVALFVSAAASGELKAAQTLFGPTRIISYYLATVLPIRFAKRLAAGGDEALVRELRATASQVLPIVGLFCLLIALFAKPLMRIFGKDFASEPMVLAFYALVAFAAYIQMVFAAALTAKHSTRQIFHATIGGGLVTLLLGVVLTRWFGIYGALTGMLLTTLSITALLYRSYVKTIRCNPDEAVMVPPEAAFA